MVKDKEKVERVVLKIPKSIAEYFRKNFPHGKRSKFFVDCILKYKHDSEVKGIEDELRDINKYR